MGSVLESSSAASSLEYATDSLLSSTDWERSSNVNSNEKKKEKPKKQEQKEEGDMKHEQLSITTTTITTTTNAPITNPLSRRSHPPNMMLQLLSTLQSKQKKFKVSFNPSLKCFTATTTTITPTVGSSSSSKTVKYKGVTKAIGKLWCKGEEKKMAKVTAKSDPLSLSLSSLSSSSSKLLVLGGSGGMMTGSGIALGKRVDSELSRLVNQMRTQSLSIEELLKLKTVNTVYHMRTLNVLQRVHYHQWIPVACQLPVGCKKTKYATAIDLLCYDPKHGIWIIIEHKSGYKSTSSYTTSKQKMKSPFNHHDNSLFNRHQLQTIATLILFCHYNNIPRSSVRAYIFRSISDIETVEHPLQDWIQQEAFPILLKQFLGYTSDKQSINISASSSSSSTSSSSSSSSSSSTAKVKRRRPQSIKPKTTKTKKSRSLSYKNKQRTPKRPKLLAIN